MARAKFHIEGKMAEGMAGMHRTTAGERDALAEQVTASVMARVSACGGGISEELLQNLQQQVACILRGDLHDTSREPQIAQEFMTRMETKMRDLSANMAKVLKSLNENEAGFSNMAQCNFQLQNQVQGVHQEIANVRGSLFDFLQQDHQKWD